MPRTGKGGSRQGTPGTAYNNRSDLRQHKVPIQTAPSQQYGQGVAHLDAQRAMPIAAAPAPAVSGPAGAGAMPAPTVQPLPLDAPSMRPDEHVMTGVSVGPGAGPEVLGGLGQAPQGAPATVSDFLSRLAAMPGAPADIQALAAFTQSRT